MPFKFPSHERPVHDEDTSGTRCRLSSGMNQSHYLLSASEICLIDLERGVMCCNYVVRKGGMWCAFIVRSQIGMPACGDNAQRTQL